MSIKSTIQQRIVAAMKAHDAQKVSALRYLLSQFKYQEINLRRPINSDEEIKLLQSEAKKRKESIEAYQKANRQDLADKEQYELSLLQEFLPKQLNDDELKQIVTEVIAKIGKDNFGNIMKETMSRVRGRADGSRVSGLVKSLLI